jgi:uncharacterized protein YecE (DUF72 family)
LLEARERKPDVPVVPKRTADFVFVRYIGHPHMEVNRPLLDEWGSYFASEMKKGAEAFMFCHATDNLIAPELCREIHKRVSNHIKIDSLPWENLQNDGMEQGRLF